ncbi:hypothetical protein HHK36_006281 [Tetracentron sinense]|uniref:BED-type domain-containing protein n=1 Tax=Tetracentron sinense TaxID=13715 RepID=A0A834ZKK2_TETSI|nr:hypothetical protein HHK36_006281 [Tetracentron sinense]
MPVFSLQDFIFLHKMATPSENEPASAEIQPNKRRRKKSIVWEHFTVEPVGAGCTRACCKQCKQTFAYSTGSKVAGTSHLKRHIALGICPVTRRNQEKNQLTPYTPGSRTGSATDPPRRRYRRTALSFSQFDQDNCRHEIAKMIIMHEYPLHMVEHPAFVSFVQHLQPRFSMVSFNTVQGDCVAMYLREKQSLLKLLGGIPGRISLTLELWTSSQTLGYVFLTGHFIDGDWKLHRRILNVVMVPTPYSEDAFSHAVVVCLADWSLESKLFTLTMDQSFSNDTVIGNLRGLLSIMNPLMLNGQLLIGKCYARVLSSIAQDALRAMREPVKRVRESVKYVKTSEAREEKFIELKQQLQVPSSKSLSLDDQTRWDTTYHMLMAALELKEVFSCLDTSDTDYKETPSVDDWKQVKTLCTYLKLLFDAANILTTASYPTANTFFHEVWKIQLDLTHAAMSQDSFISNLTKPLQEKFDNYWKDCSLVLAIAVVMDPRFKMKLVEFSFSKIYGEDAGTYIKVVDEGIHELFREYMLQPLALTPAYVEEGNTCNHKTEVPQENSGNLKTEVPQENSDNPKTVVPQENSDNAKTEVTQENADSAKTEVVEGNADYAITEVPEGNADYAMTEVPVGNADYAKTEVPDGNADYAITEVPEGNVEYAITEVPGGNSDYAITEVPRGNGDYAITEVPEGNGDYAITKLSPPKMTNFDDQIKEIETLLSSNTRADKSFAYSTLLHLQEQSSNDSSAIHALSERSHSLLSLILPCISDDDEEIAAQGLKCLGFMIYHPSLVSSVPEDVANVVVESLVKLVTTTKMKAICNLGVWCISIQQFNLSFLAAHFHSLLRAIIHGLDNPIGSLSTTFEAIQIPFSDRCMSSKDKGSLGRSRGGRSARVVRPPLYPSGAPCFEDNYEADPSAVDISPIPLRSGAISSLQLPRDILGVGVEADLSQNAPIICGFDTVDEDFPCLVSLDSRAHACSAKVSKGNSGFVEPHVEQVIAKSTSSEIFGGDGQAFGQNQAHPELGHKHSAWRSLFVGAKPSNPDAKLEFIQPQFINGELVIERSDQEIEEDSLEWQNTLLSCPEDKETILNGGPWRIQQAMLVLREWNRHTKLDKIEFLDIPIWIEIYNLPLFMWKLAFFSAIGSIMRRPLCIDNPTLGRSHLNYARISVKVSVANELPDTVLVRLNPNTAYLLHLEYDWKPPLCAKCKVFGHSDDSCGRGKQSENARQTRKQCRRSKSCGKCAKQPPKSWWEVTKQVTGNSVGPSSRAGSHENGQDEFMEIPDELAEEKGKWETIASKKKKLNLWQKLKSFANTHNQAWMVLGDLNSILFSSEKRGDGKVRDLLGLTVAWVMGGLTGRDIRSIRAIRDTLQIFQKSGLCPSTAKSQVFFGNVDSRLEKDISDTLGIKRVSLYTGVTFSIFRKPYAVTLKEPLLASYGMTYKTPLGDIKWLRTLGDHSIDRIIWQPKAHGEFSLKTAWESIRGRNAQNQWHKVMWFNNNIPKHSFITWLATREALSTMDKMMSRGFIGVNACVLCCQDHAGSRPLVCSMPSSYNCVYSPVGGALLTGSPENAGTRAFLMRSESYPSAPLCTTFGKNETRDASTRNPCTQMWSISISSRTSESSFNIGVLRCQIAVSIGNLQITLKCRFSGTLLLGDWSHGSLPPNQGCMRLNTNGSVRSNIHGYGFIIRNEEGMPSQAIAGATETGSVISMEHIAILKDLFCCSPFKSIVALAIDIKKKLLPGMKELLNQGMKVQTIQAWGWFIRLLGSYAMKNRQLVNEMLKIPEQTFSDHDPQVQIASQVSWQGLVDALINPPGRASGTNKSIGHGIQQAGIVPLDASKGDFSENHADGFSKSIKLIMTPLVGIMSSKCDTSVHLSCLNTWCYLLHKLDILVNCPLVIKTVLEPIFEVIFQMDLDSNSTWLWNSCLELLDEFISAKCRDIDYGSNNQVSSHLSARAASLRPLNHYKCLWEDYPIKWLPWDLTKLDFHLKMIYILISQGSRTTVTSENRSLACNAALRIFRSVLKGVQIELQKSSINYNEIMLSLNTILRFTKRVCEDITSKDIGIDDSLHNSLRFVEAVREELEPSLLGCPLYRLALDLKYIENVHSVSDNGHAKVLEISSIAYMDMVSPMVYLTILYLCLVAQSTSNAPEPDFILQGMHKYLKFILSSYDPSENLHAIIGLLYKHIGLNWLKIWILIAKGLKDYICGIKDLSFLKNESDSTGSVAVCWFLSYPFVVCSFQQKLLIPVEASGSSELSLVSSELEHVTEVWKSLYGSLICASQSECSTMNGFAEDLCPILTGILNENTSMLECGTELYLNDKNQALSLFSEVAICVLKHILVLDLSSRGSENTAYGEYKKSSDIKNSLEFIARFMTLSRKNMKTETGPDITVISKSCRVFSAVACFAGRLYMKQDILLFVEIIVSPLFQWLSYEEIQEDHTVHQLQLLWSETLNCLQTSSPPIIFDSNFLKIQAPLLEKTLDHPNSSISELTITFWNSTYGEQIKLDYPHNLLEVLDKLSRTGRINLHKRSLPFFVNSHSRVEATSVPQRYRVTAKQRSSKRVEFMKDTGNEFEYNDNPLLGMKRKRLELTDHQKEVRRAQQGRERDCNGHGPGIRTYTSVDFSQGNEDSQESQELRNPESILEMLKRAG